jgi:hypothetical protein
MNAATNGVPADVWAVAMHSTVDRSSLLTGCKPWTIRLELRSFITTLPDQFGLVGVISPIGISPAIAERQTPLPSICLPEDQQKASWVG